MVAVRFAVVRGDRVFADVHGAGDVQGEVDQLSWADVQRVARRLLDASKLLVVVVGKPEGMATGQ